MTTTRLLVRSAAMSILPFLLATLPAAQGNPRLSSVPANAGASCESNVDLRVWAAESYPAVSGFGAGIWNVALDGSTVTQTVNGQPTFFHSDFDVMSTTVEGEIVVNGGDDDYIGFALGFEPGDSTAAAAEYWLIDWKGSTQSFNFGSPSCSPSTTAQVGLAVSHVFGIPTADEFWGHENFDESCSDLDNGLTELARATTLGATGWQTGVSYRFRFEYSPTSLRVFVNDMLELDVPGTYSSGRIAFYNFSQAGVTYSTFDSGALASWSEYGSGWPGTAGVPSLALSAAPVLGTAVDIQIGNSAQADTWACLLLGPAPGNIPTAFGGELLVQQPYLDVTALHPLPAAGMTLQLPVPADPSFCGSRGYMQMFQIDPGASHGFSTTRGLELILGD